MDISTASELLELLMGDYQLTEDDGSTWTVADSGLSDVSSYLSFYI